MTTPRRSDERGVAALEFAMVLPVLLALVSSVIFAGWLGVTRAVLEHGVDEGLRHATIPASSDLRSYPTAVAIAEHVDAATPILTPSAVTVTPSDGVANGEVTVEVTYAFTNPVAVLWAPMAGLGLPTVPPQLTMTASSRGRRE